MTAYVIAPAYGRDYRSAADALRAYREGLDFEVLASFPAERGSYLSIRDIDATRDSVMIRFDKRRKVTEA